MGLFSKLKNAMKKTREGLSGALSALFSKNKIDSEFYDELEEILIGADISVTTAEEIVDDLRAEAKKEKLKDKEFVTGLLKDILEEKLTEAEELKIKYPAIIMLVGVNGVGKTTTVGKLASYFLSQKKSVVVAAADTFRAAASDQLTVWADRAKVRIVKHEEGSDPSAVVFDALSSAKAKGTDVVIIDTAGRLHVKANLMEELKKMSRVVERECLEHIKRLCAELGIKLNEKKTQIIKLSRGFTFLKVRFRYGKNGAVIRRACYKSIKHMRDKLKVFRRWVDSGRMAKEDVDTSVTSFRGHMRRFNDYFAVQTVEREYRELFAA